ncbi:MAG: hypothetical protein WC328_01485 [Kiritimatiellia bacterium]|jgi:hypothetical protein|nr:hypothetical protein [Kiritimatiellia bacterium]MDD4172783.1 hypothetical protein [Kiritimatiellia bacterium]MDD4441633.1 hypothetical protein [Kiritimatiellia bacterium]MDX9792035.1 hypothetical protein [Kiritimatiellia bacterium]
MKNYHYETSCVSSTAELIDAMTEQARPVTLRTLRRHCRYLREWEKDMGYATDNQIGLRLQDDITVRFYRSRYDGMPCYYIDHSGIEHIWTRSH